MSLTFVRESFHTFALLLFLFSFSRVSVPLSLLLKQFKDLADTETSQKRLISGLKDVLDWSEIEVATTFF